MVSNLPKHDLHSDGHIKEPCTKVLLMKWLVFQENKNICTPLII